MNLNEYIKVKDYQYEEYVAYLNNKHGMVPRKYGDRKFNKRPGEGLFIHHVREDVVASLSNSKIRKANDPVYQEPQNLVYCDYLEHLLLHIKIGENTAGGRNLGLNGPFVYIIPALKNFFNYGWKNQRWAAYFDVVANDKDVFDLLLEKYNKLIEDIDIVLEENQTLYAEVEKCLDEKGKALVVLGTGLGKTTTALQYIWKHGCRALVIGPNRLIKDGWDKYGDWIDTDTYIGFSNKYLNVDYEKYGLVILDEAHHAGYDEESGKGAEVWSKGVRHLLDNGIKVLGLTATPERSDDINVGESLFKDCVCEGRAIEDAMEEGVVYIPSYITALYNTSELYDQYKDCENKELVGQLDLAINNTPTLKQTFEKYMPSGPRKGIIFVQEIEDEQYVLDIMKDVYPDAEIRMIHSQMAISDVRENRKWFENTKSGYLIAVNMISEGAHYSGVNTLIMFRRTNSYLVYTQQIGRIITLTKDEDPHAIIFDLVNNCENVQYNDRKINNDKCVHSISRIVEAIKKAAEKSDQIIVADETRDIVECIRKIKEYNDDSWTDEEDNIIRKYYPNHGPEECTKHLNKNRSITAIRQRAKFLKIYREGIKEKEYWTENDVLTLKKYYVKEGKDVLYRLPNHTWDGCLIMASKLQLYTKRWSEQEVSILRKYYSFNPSYCLEELRKINPRRSRVTMVAKANAMGIITAPSWTDEEIETLKKFFPIEGGMCYKRFANKTKSSVVGYASKLGIHSQRNWTSEEISILKQYYPTEGIEVVKRLPNRNKDTCQAKAASLGIKSNNKSCPRNIQWTKEEDDIIRRFYPTEGFECLHRLPGRGKSSVQSRAYILGVKSIKEQDMSFCSKSVRCVETGVIYKSIVEAKKECGGDVYTCLKKGPQATAGGYHWEYVEEEE